MIHVDVWLMLILDVLILVCEYVMVFESADFCWSGMNYVKCVPLVMVGHIHFDQHPSYHC